MTIGAGPQPAGIYFTMLKTPGWQEDQSDDIDSITLDFPQNRRHLQASLSYTKKDTLKEGVFLIWYPAGYNMRNSRRGLLNESATQPVFRILPSAQHFTPQITFS